MPENQNFGFNIIVGNETLMEYTAKDGNIFVESTMEAANSYNIQSGSGTGEHFDVMVTPYKIMLETKIGAPTRCYHLYIDGHKVASNILHGGQKEWISGCREHGYINEFVFRFPPEVNEQSQAVKTSILNHIGEITIRAFDAVDTGRLVRTPTLQSKPVQNTTMTTETAVLKNVTGVTKNDCSKQTDGRYPLLATGIGRPCLEMLPGDDEKRLYTVGAFETDTLSVYYRPRLALQILGIIESNACGDKISCDSPKKLSNSGSPINSNDSKANIISSPPGSPLPSHNIHTDGCRMSTPCAKRGGGASLQDDSGICNTDLWDDTDRSIILEGDQDCWIANVRKPTDISLVELDSDEDEHRSNIMQVD